MLTSGFREDRTLFPGQELLGSVPCIEPSAEGTARGQSFTLGTAPGHCSHQWRGAGGERGGNGGAAQEQALGDFARVVDAAAASSPPPRAKGLAVLALLVQELLSQAWIR